VRRRYLIPEVIQSSATDCGPACLKALLAGFGIYLSYGRLREACQTDVDGTSIDTLESLAGDLGARAEQSMLPADLLLSDGGARLPALVVVRLPDGATHFVVLWRVLGRWVQVMDPSVGRVWLPRRQLMEQLYQHEQQVPREAWETWSQGADFRRSIELRLKELGAPGDYWANPAAQDAALRLASALQDAGQLRRGADTRRLLELCAASSGEIPAQFWFAHADPAQSDTIVLRGAVLLAVHGLATDAKEPSREVGATASTPHQLSHMLAEPPPDAWAPVRAALRECRGTRLAIATGVALCATAAGTVVEALLFRGLFDMGRHLESTYERIAGFGAVLVFLMIPLALDWPAAIGLKRLGRQLETRLRVRFLRKIPRLADHYFQSRLLSDMATRAHSLQLLRQLPQSAARYLQLAAAILVTGVAIAWVYPGSGALAALAVLSACGLPAAFLPSMNERDLRQRELAATLSSGFIDGLLGGRAVQAHVAERTMLLLQAEQLQRWAGARVRQLLLFTCADAIQGAVSVALVMLLVYREAIRMDTPAGLLLLIYWALSIPVLGSEAAEALRALPGMRNTLLRFLEPLGAPDEEPKVAQAPMGEGGARVEFDGVCVVAGGHTVLDGLSWEAQPGEHIAIVGSSGAGKSSLVGCLLGWHAPTAGVIRVDGVQLDSAGLWRLRRATAWVDPQVHLFRATLFENLRYGNGGDPGAHIGHALDETELGQILEQLPAGLQTPIGEGGALLSGGEGQRVRIGRALGRSAVRLLILDELARGLGREQRKRALSAARRRFPGATVLCVTHDIADTLDFDRVLVVERGSIREQGSPHVLATQPGSRYRALLEEERAVGAELWARPSWRRLMLHEGVLHELTAKRCGGVHGKLAVREVKCVVPTSRAASDSEAVGR
jgi:ABC-type bacteriocin/lantibiotic exporter with double-glycine peptidase domain